MMDYTKQLEVENEELRTRLSAAELEVSNLNSLLEKNDAYFTPWRLVYTTLPNNLNAGMHIHKKDLRHPNRLEVHRAIDFLSKHRKDAQTLVIELKKYSKICWNIQFNRVGTTDNWSYETYTPHQKSFDARSWKDIKKFSSERVMVPWKNM